MPDTALLAVAPPVSAVGYPRDLRSNVASRAERSGEESASSAVPATTFAETLHAVQRGETLSSVVSDYLTSQGRNPSPTEIYKAVQQVAQANHLANPNRIRVQQTIDLSPLATPPAIVARAVPTASPVLRTVESILEGTGAPSAPQSAASLRSRLASEVTPNAVGERPESEPVSVRNLRKTARVSREPRQRIDLSELVRRILHPDEYRAEQAASAAASAAATSDETTSVQKTDSEPWQTLLDHAATLSSGYGMRPDPFTGRLAFHDGIDLAAPAGTAIRPVSPGTVIFSGWKAGYGRTVTVRHADGTESSYCHASMTCVTAGDRVTQETMVARVGTTGRSTGPHLHFQVNRDGRSIDPLQVFHPTNMRLARR